MAVLKSSYGGDMCGQFAVLGSLKAVKDYYNFLSSGDFSFDDQDSFDLDDFSDVKIPNQSVLPMSFMPIVTYKNKRIIMKKARWGLVPFWVKDESFAYKTINARRETLSEKASFKYALKERRCLIPFSGYYERDKNKKLHYFPNEDEKLQSFAGLYEIWGKDNLTTFTIITCDADEKVMTIHPRMPVVMNEEEGVEWLSFK